MARRSEIESLRSSAEEQDRDALDTRAMTLRVETVDEKTRSVDGILATESPTVVMDRERWEPISEVLRMDGCRLPDRLPLLADHDRSSALGVHGSITECRIIDGQLRGRLSFLDGDEETDRIWNRVRQGHLRDLSVGYRVSAAEPCEPGKRCTVRGTEYTAPANMRLRVATDWTPRECSVVAIGADPGAKTRAAQDLNTETRKMDPKLRALLEKLGLRKEADEAEAMKFAAEYAPKPPEPEAERKATETPPAKPAEPAPVNVDAERKAAVDAERKRVAEITRLGEGLPADVVRKAIDDGVTVADASVAFLTAMRAQRTPPAGGGGPAIHNHDPNAHLNAQTVGLALAMRSVDGERYLRLNAAYAADGPVRRDGTDYTIRRAVDTEAHKKAMSNLLEQADAFRALSLPDVCRLACQLDGLQVGFHTSPAEAFRTAVSGSALANIFTTNINAQFLTGYMDAVDTTVGWCSETDVANFLTQERDTMGKFGSLQRLAKGQKAEHLDTSDWKESYKIARYAGQFVVDEMDIINDRFGALESQSPMDMGLTARQLRPNLVYYAVLANGNLDVDGRALFEASYHKNYGTSGTAFAASTLQAAIAAMAKQRIRDRVINIRPRYLIVPQDLRFAAEIVLTSSQRIISADSGGTFNPLERLGIQIVSDDRMGVAGVTDPLTGTAQAGTAANYLLAARPGEEGAKTIEVGYLRGTGRAPQLRSFILDKGQWGIGWDIKFDIGCKPLDFRGLYFCTGGA